MHSGADGSRFSVGMLGEKALKMNNFGAERKYCSKTFFTSMIGKKLHKNKIIEDSISNLSLYDSKHHSEVSEQEL
jgi:hypothetical protein